MTNASGQYASTVTVSGSEKKSEQDHKQQRHIFSIIRVTRKFQDATTTGKKCKKKCASRAKVVFCY